ncbi:alpha/beta hydrolase [Aspergillus stella-maris]|uniref:alpha/beta hydrolase n=1 Tax=Aspergillus stella-maris TaxID=1810926 RepID=UPI003CCD107E
METKTSHPQPPYPLHELIRDLADPEFAKFYNQYLLHAPQVHYQPVAASRVGGKIIPGGTDPIPVGSTIDVQIPRTESSGPPVLVQVLVPPGAPPKPGGWPVFLWHHGGGWVLGNIDSENNLYTNLCVRANCVVITTDYQMAPENPFPATVHDAWEALAVGGSSAGGNLATIMTQKAIGHRLFAERRTTGGCRGFLYQTLVVPVTDNTETVETSETYKSYEYTAALPVDKMLWYRRHYLPNATKWLNPEASPLLADKEMFGQLPRALVGEEYAWKLNKGGVHAEVKVVKGVPHCFIVMDRVLQKGKDEVGFLCDRLAAAFES